MVSWAMALPRTDNSHHYLSPLLHLLISARVAPQLRLLVDQDIPAQFLITVRQSVGEWTPKDSWVTVELSSKMVVQAPLNHHPQRLTLAQAEQPLPFLLKTVTFAPFLTTAK